MTYQARHVLPARTPSRRTAWGIAAGALMTGIAGLVIVTGGGGSAPAGHIAAAAVPPALPAAGHGTAPAVPGAIPAATYTVRRGDTLWGIARRLCGDGNKEGVLYQGNRAVIGGNSWRLKPGMTLTRTC